MKKKTLDEIQAINCIRLAYKYGVVQWFWFSVIFALLIAAKLLDMQILEIIGFIPIVACFIAASLESNQLNKAIDILKEGRK